MNKRVYVLLLAVLTVLLLTDKTNSQNWTEISTGGSPPPRANASAIYYPAGNKIIIFGGRNVSGNLNDVWSLDLSTNQWQDITPLSGPMPTQRFTANALYDSVMNRMIIWSGQGAMLYNDVWAFNLSNNTWQELWTDGNVSGAPLKRYGTAAVFDPISRRLVNFAGFTTSGRFDDTWSFQVDSIIWNDRTNAVFPEMRCLHSASIARNNSRMIIYGGQHNGQLDDIWSLDLVSYNWTNITPAVKPAGRWFSPIITTKYDDIVIYGGQNSLTTLGDLWKFSLDSMKWDSIFQGGVKPSDRWGHSSVYIPGSDKLIIFGGADPDYKNDTWEFSNIGTVGITQTGGTVPLNFRLGQNYPNPFNPSTKIRFEVPADGQGKIIKLNVFNLLGQEAAVLVNQQLGAGTYEYTFDGSRLPSGVYFYSLKSDSKTIFTKKMLLVK